MDATTCDKKEYIKEKPILFIKEIIISREECNDLKTNRTQSEAHNIVSYSFKVERSGQESNNDSIKIVASNANSCAIADHCIYLWGDQPFRENMLPIEVENVALGPKHAFAWKENIVYCWGSNENYELGLEEEKIYSCEKVSLFEKAVVAGLKLKDISCGQQHTIAIFEEKQEENTKEPYVWELNENDFKEGSFKLFGWGQSESHQLTINSKSILPYPILSNCAINKYEQIASKSDYNAIICGGNVYTWGANVFSRLGQSEASTVRIPEKIFLPIKVKKIGLGKYHAIAVCESGEAFSWGKGTQGQLGIGRLEAETKPIKIANECEIENVSCGENHSLILLRNGKIKSCGTNALGHINYDKDAAKKRCSTFQYIDLNNCKEIACGDKHCLALTYKGEIYGWGNNEFGQALFEFSEPVIESRKTKRPLELIIDDGSDKWEKCKQKVFEWKIKYDFFKQKQAIEEEKLFSELEFIFKE